MTGMTQIRICDYGVRDLTNALRLGDLRFFGENKVIKDLGLEELVSVNQTSAPDEATAKRVRRAIKMNRAGDRCVLCARLTKGNLAHVLSECKGIEAGWRQRAPPHSTPKELAEMDSRRQRLGNMGRKWLLNPALDCPWAGALRV